MKGFGQYVKKREYFLRRSSNMANSRQRSVSSLLSTQHSSPFSALPGYYS
jgi:hypothetical protein